MKWVCYFLPNLQRGIIKKRLHCTNVQDVGLSSEMQRHGYLILPHSVALCFEVQNCLW